MSERGPHATARKRPYSSGASPQTAATDLPEGLGMKCFHLMEVPHLLTSIQKAMRLEMAKVMAQ
jgi:hypothetical protein